MKWGVHRIKQCTIEFTFEGESVEVQSTKEGANNTVDGKQLAKALPKTSDRVEFLRALDGVMQDVCRNLRCEVRNGLKNKCKIL